MSVYVLIAIDDDYRVKECIVVADSDIASQVYNKLREVYDGDKVYMASRAVGDVPQNIVSAFLPKPAPPKLSQCWIGGGRHG